MTSNAMKCYLDEKPIEASADVIYINHNTLANCFFDTGERPVQYTWTSTWEMSGIVRTKGMKKAMNTGAKLRRRSTIKGEFSLFIDKIKEDYA